MSERTLVGTSINGHVQVKQPWSSPNDMTNIYREYITPHVICVCGKLDENLASLLHIYGCSIDPCYLVGIWMLYWFHL